MTLKLIKDKDRLWRPSTQMEYIGMVDCDRLDWYLNRNKTCYQTTNEPMGFGYFIKFNREIKNFPLKCENLYYINTTLYKGGDGILAHIYQVKISRVLRRGKHWNLEE